MTGSANTESDTDSRPMWGIWQNGKLFKEFPTHAQCVTEVFEQKWMVWAKGKSHLAYGVKILNPESHAAQLQVKRINRDGKAL